MFTESWSPDQLLQMADLKNHLPFGQANAEVYLPKAVAQVYQPHFSLTLILLYHSKCCMFARQLIIS